MKTFPGLFTDRAQRERVLTEILNHLTPAFDGEIYLVAPRAWASLYGRLSGSHPVLPVVA